jgi:hypothetical protein
MALGVHRLRIAALAVLASGGLVAPAAGATEVLKVVERATNEHVVDVGARGDSLGDLLVFANPVYDAANVKAIGSSDGYCVRTVVGKRWQCTWTMRLGDDALLVAGEYPDDSDADLAITGGTGHRAGARGTLHVHARDAAHTSYDFVVTLQ